MPSDETNGDPSSNPLLGTNSSRFGDRPRSRKHLVENVLPKFVRFEAEPIYRALGNRNEIRVMDVGANVGLWSKAMFHTLGNHLYHAWLIEPQSANVVELLNSSDPILFEPREMARISVVPVAAGSAVSEQVFYSNVAGSPLGSLYQQNDLRVGLLAASETVQVVTVDLLMHILRIPRLDVLKIDAEGHDYAVLLGAQKALKNNLIDIIEFEFGETAIISRTFVQDFWKLLTPYGYDFICSAERRGEPFYLSRNIIPSGKNLREIRLSWRVRQIAPKAYRKLKLLRVSGGRQRADIIFE
jgi:FkbM family methyltransferase